MGYYWQFCNSQAHRHENTKQWSTGSSWAKRHGKSRKIRDGIFWVQPNSQLILANASIHGHYRDQVKKLGWLAGQSSCCQTWQKIKRTFPLENIDTTKNEKKKHLGGAKQKNTEGGEDRKTGYIHWDYCHGASLFSAAVWAQRGHTHKPQIHQKYGHKWSKHMKGRRERSKGWHQTQTRSKNVSLNQTEGWRQERGTEREGGTEDTRRSD